MKSRKDQGTIGKSRIVWTNCWDFDMDYDKEVYCYDVKICALYKKNEEQPMSQSRELQSHVRYIAEG